MTVEHSSTERHLLHCAGDAMATCKEAYEQARRAYERIAHSLSLLDVLEDMANGLPDSVDNRTQERFLAMVFSLKAHGEVALEEVSKCLGSTQAANARLEAAVSAAAIEPPNGQR
jgi:hypothetical protein